MTPDAVCLLGLQVVAFVMADVAYRLNMQLMFRRITKIVIVLVSPVISHMATIETWNVLRSS
jgi:hypothetical protein